MFKKIFFFFLFVLIFAAGISGGFICGRGKIGILSGIKILADICPSSELSAGFNHSDILEKVKEFFISSDNYQTGISETYKNFPLLPGTTEKNVWTFLRPVEGILYTTSMASGETMDFYRRKLKEEGWVEKEIGGSLSLIFLRFEKASAGLNLFLHVGDLPPQGLPKELNLSRQTYVSISIFKK